MTVTRKKVSNSDVNHRTVYLEDEPDFEQRSAQKRRVLSEGINYEGKDEDYNFGSPVRRFVMGKKMYLFMR